jgi:hypothetical protein
MKLICPISNYRYRIPDINLKGLNRSIHPLIELSLPEHIEVLNRLTYDLNYCNPVTFKLITIGSLYQSKLLLFNSPCLIQFDSIQPFILQSSLNSLIRVLTFINSQVDLEILKGTQYLYSTCQSKELYIPRIGITSDSSKSTLNLNNLNDWCKLWQDSIDEYYLTSKIRRKENKIKALELSYLTDHNHSNLITDYKTNRGIKNIESLIEWASLAGKFPNDKHLNYNGNKISLNKYFQLIIKLCSISQDVESKKLIAEQIKLFSLNRDDISECLEYCMLNLPPENALTLKVIEVIKNGLNIVSNYIKEINTHDEDLKLLDTFKDIPSIEPNKIDYPNSSSYLLAMAKYGAKMNAIKRLNESKLENNYD